MKKLLYILLLIAFNMNGQITVAKKLIMNGNTLTDATTGDTLATLEWVNDTIQHYVKHGTDTLSVGDSIQLNGVWYTSISGNVTSAVPQNLANQTDNGILFIDGDSLATDSRVTYVPSTNIYTVNGEMDVQYLQIQDRNALNYNSGVLEIAGGSFTSVDIQEPTQISDNLTVDGDSINAPSSKLKSKIFIGELYVDGDSTLSIPVAATYYTFKKWNTTGVNVNVTADDSTLTIDAGGSGYYDIKHHESIKGISNATIHMSVFVNDVEITKCEVERKISTGGDVGASSASMQIWLNDGDVVKLKYKSLTLTGTLTVTHSNFNISRHN